MRLLRLCLWVVVVAVLGLGVSALVQHPGMVDVTWLGYQVQVSFAVLAIALVLVVIGFAVLVSWMEHVLALPSHVRHEREMSKQHKGVEAMTLAFASLAASDVAAAEKHTRKAQELLGEIPLLDLLGAQVAHKQGDNAQTHVHLEKLAAYKPTRFMANRALAGMSLRAGDANKALEYAQAASKDKPQQLPVQLTALGLLLRVGRWADAEKIIFQARLRRHIAPEKVQHFYALLYFCKAQQYRMMLEQGEDTAHAMLKKACDHEAGFVPAAVALADSLAARTEYRAAFKVLEKAWRVLPHPALADTLLSLSAHEAESKREKRVQGFAELQPNTVASAILQAKLALDARRYEDAKYHLKTALNVQESGEALRMLAQIEHKQAPTEQAMRAADAWLERAAKAPRSAAWVCDQCGHVHDAWQLFCAGCETFDSVAWRVPAPISVQDDSLKLLS